MPLKVFKWNKLYSYRGTVAGRRLRGPTGTADKRIAERIVAEIEAKAWQSHLDGPGATLTFAQVAIAYRQAVCADRFLDRVGLLDGHACPEDHRRGYRPNGPQAVSRRCQRHFEPSRHRTGAGDHQLRSEFGVVRTDQGEAVQSRYQEKNPCNTGMGGSFCRVSGSR